jgi:uncharacterized membrane protein YdjX (TVP38/TMEM64 family)
MNSVRNRLLAMIIVILVIGVLGFLTRQFGSMEWLVENETRMREFVQLYPWQGWLLGLAIYTAFSLVPGTAGKSVVFGWVFGFWQGVLMVDIGLTIAAMGGFFASRFIVRDAVNARFSGLVEKLDRSLKRDGAFYLLMIRLAHVPYSFVNYAAGATSVPLRTFCWTTSLGILPGTMIFVFVGTRIPTLAELSEKGVWQLFDPLLFAVLAATIAFPVLIRWAIGKYRKHNGSLPEIELLEMESFNSWSVPRQVDGTH